MDELLRRLLTPVPSTYDPRETKSPPPPDPDSVEDFMNFYRNLHHQDQGRGQGQGQGQDQGQNKEQNQGQNKEQNQGQGQGQNQGQDQGQQRVTFLQKLSRDFGVDHGGVAELCVKLVEAQRRDAATVLQVEERLRDGLTPRYRHLLHHVSRAEGGVKFLVDLRADLLQIIASKSTDSPHIRVRSHYSA